VNVFAGAAHGQAGVVIGRGEVADVDAEVVDMSPGCGGRPVSGAVIASTAVGAAAGRARCTPWVGSARRGATGIAA
jgi:hypothetical protein